MPKDAAFADEVQEVVILRDGKRCVIVPADPAWDEVFARSGTDLGERDQPGPQAREAF